jgi:hypothetical protein
MLLLLRSPDDDVRTNNTEANVAQNVGARQRKV